MTSLAQKNRLVAIRAALFGLAMLGLAFASVPLYRIFCQATGFGGTTMKAEAAPGAVAGQVGVRFDANIDSDLGWTFKPMQTRMDLKIGENGLAFYEAVNNTDQPLTGTASYNVAPDVAGYYFIKVQCFCFTEQTLQPGERVEMPVSFYVDPALVNDPDADYVRDITLSYTFHRTEPRSAALDTAPAENIN